MKNRLLEPLPKNGLFWCYHNWVPSGLVGENWDLTIGVSVPCTCTKCGRKSDIPNTRIEEVPDELVTPSISYCHSYGSYDGF
jgi:hypothetical protein